jgi:flagellar motility protein MotE (MotC chaperone)
MKSFITSIAVSSLFLGSAISLFLPLTSSSEDGVKTETQATSPEAGNTEAANTAAAKTANEAQPAAARPQVEAVSSCLSDPVVLDEIKKKHEEIDKKWKDLAAHEAELKARESAVDEELKKLQTVRDEIAKIESDHLQANQEKVAKVVETLEGMNPKAASLMIATLDEHLAVMAMDQMSTAKLSKVMNVMEPARATKLTELLAGVVRAKHSGSNGLMTASNDAAETSIVPETKSGTQKGEMKNDQQSEQIISGGPDTVAKRSPSSKSP